MPGIKFTEFYAERQGRPDSKIAVDMESHVTPVVSSSALSLTYLAAVILTYEGEMLSQDGSVLYRS